MDYEKFHNETSRNLQEMVRKGLITEAIAKGICVDFVAESEDERIRKELIAEVKEQIDCIPAPDCRDKEDEKALKQLNKWLAWLEKQKGTEREIEGNSLCKGEQKPVGWSEDLVKEVLLSEVLPSFMHGGEADEVVAKLDEVMSTKVIEQPKQEWSEEDRKMYARIVRSYTSYEGRILYATDLSEDNRNNILEDLNEQELWLKYRLKTIRPQKQCCNDVPSREYILNVWELGNYWKELTKGVCSTEHGTQLEYIQNHWKEGEFYDKISVCPQNKWKPSEGQVKALLWVIENTTKSKDVNILLNSLYEDLKTL